MCFFNICFIKFNNKIVLTDINLIFMNPNLKKPYVKIKGSRNEKSAKYTFV